MPQTQTVAVALKGNWLVGETVQCVAMNDPQRDVKKDYYLDCTTGGDGADRSDGRFHSMTVHFSRHIYSASAWDCRRNQTSFDCDFVRELQ